MTAGSIALYVAAIQALWHGEAEEATTLEREAVEAGNRRRRVKAEAELQVLGKELPPASEEQDEAWVRGRKASALHKAFDKLFSASAEASVEATSSAKARQQLLPAQDDDMGGSADAPLDGTQEVPVGKRRKKKKAAAAPDA